ncbi:MAG: pilus assembly protein [Planctomycetes bacterium]|nr:pilus assembly protein [Planctomycetota bacterium]
MTEPILLDTGPFVACINERDRYHEWSVAHWQRIRPPLLTCEAVVSEAAFLLYREGYRPQRVLEFLHRGAVEVRFQLQREVEAVRHLMTKYADSPMSLADACLVRMSELVAGARVFTIDAHFRVYRRNGRQVIPVIAPDARS